MTTRPRNLSVSGTGVRLWVGKPGGDMAAHIRTHLILDSEDHKNIRATLADAEKLVHPVDALEVKVKTVRADRNVLLKKLTHGYRKLLTAVPSKEVGVAAKDEAEDKEEPE